MGEHGRMVGREQAGHGAEIDELALRPRGQHGRVRGAEIEGEDGAACHQAEKGPGEAAAAVGRAEGGARRGRKEDGLGGAALDPRRRFFACQTGRKRLSGLASAAAIHAASSRR